MDSNVNSSTEFNPFVPPEAALEDSRDSADTTFQLNLFSRAGRIGRIRYLGYSMGLWFLIMAVTGVLSALVWPGLLVLGYVALLYVQIMLAIKRSHDFDVTGWLALLAFVPLLNLAFLFVPGTDGPNRFGRKTAPNGHAGVIVIVALFAFMLIGILAAIAIPAYQEYTQRAQAAQMR